jgi:predicted outer membrane repeat protein
MANYLVTTLADETYNGGNLAAEMADGGGLSLREALAIANASATHDDITFAVAGTMFLINGQLLISSDVTIDGDSDGGGKADITVDGNDISRVFNITAGTSTLESLGISNGYVKSLAPGSSVPDDAGGGVYIASAANVTFANSTFLNNEAAGWGGAVFNYGTLTLIDSTLSSNAAHFLGGGGLFNFGTATLLNTTLSGNEAGAYGGGLENYGVATLVNTTVSGNSAPFGGGINNYNGSLALINSTVSGNSALGGGGIWARGTVTVANSIVAGNAASGGDDVLGSPTLYGGNIVGDTFTIDGGSPQNGIALTDIFASVVNNPHTAVPSGELADSGGPVETIALKRSEANPAIDSADPDFLDETITGTDLNGDGDTADVIDTDARGFPRDVDFDASGGTPDLGAFEVQNGVHLIVTTLSDSGDDATGGGKLEDEMTDGDGLSLREALILANGSDLDDDPTNGTLITFDPGLTGGLNPGVDDGVITLEAANGELIISSDVTIDGDTDGDDKADITVDGGDAIRVLKVVSGTSTLESLAITNGFVPGPFATGRGGGVYIASTAEIIISHSDISDNKASVLGGGVFIAENAKATIEHSSISENDGGGIYTGDGAVVMVSHSTLSNNSGGPGGGLRNEGTTTLINSIVSDNSASNTGGGILNAYGGGLTLINTTVSGNYATFSGGGIENSGTAMLANVSIHNNSAAHFGGGIDSQGTLTAINSTVWGNSAGNLGGGIWNSPVHGIEDDFPGILNIFNSTITGNYATYSGGGVASADGDAVTITNSIVAGNGAGSADDDITDSDGSSAYDGVNIFSQAGAGDGGDIVETDLSKIFATLTTIDPDGISANGDEFQAGELADNGGPVQTVAIKATGVAHDTGDNSKLPLDNQDLDGDNDTTEPLPIDARGQPRVVHGIVDVGAFEVPNAPPEITTGASHSIAENATFVVDIDSTDDFNSENSGLTYEISGGADATLFDIDKNTGVLSFLAAPDFENPQDDGKNNTYEVTVEVSDVDGASDEQAFTVTVTDVDGKAITGNGANNNLNGTDEEDLINARGGNDSVDALGGNDTVNGENGNDTLNGGDGNDLLNGGNGNDTVNGGGGDDVLMGAVGRDSLDGGEGNDSLDGGAANDTIKGGNGDDTLNGGEQGNDSLDGGAGNDLMFGGVGADTLLGGADDDTIDAGGGNDNVEGNEGADSINGNTGADTINGGADADIMAGGPGKDRFVFAAGDSTQAERDEITDFVHGGAQAEVLDVSALGFTGGFDGNAATPGAFGVAWFFDGTNTIVRGDTNGDPDSIEFELELNGNHPLTAANFDFTP